MTILTCLIIIVLLIAGDQASKMIIAHTIAEFDHITIIKNVVDFTHRYNTGGAFSMLDNAPTLMLILSIIGVLVIPYFFKDASFKRRPLYTIALCLIYSGAWGNFIDRLLFGKVLDFIELTFINFAVFNFADSCLTVGMILLCIYIFFFESKDPLVIIPKKKKEETKDV